MIELAKHIENLLLDNDCVIVPGLGGFVAHYSPSKRIEDESLFLSPTRTVGFNPQLQLNDGLLVQSYMSHYGLSFPEANRMVAKAVSDLQDRLHTLGKVSIPNVGEISYDIFGAYGFEAYEHKLSTPSLYGLDSFEIKTLAQLRNEIDVQRSHKESPVLYPTKKEIRIRIDYLRNAVASVAAVIFFFILSTPLENTQVRERNYAELFPMEVLQELCAHSMALTPLCEESSNEFTETSVTSELEPETKTAVEVEIVNDYSPTSSVENNMMVKPQYDKVTSKQELRYHIIVAGGLTRKKAEQIVFNLQQKGFSEARILAKDGKIRVGILSFAKFKDAECRLAEIRQQQEFADAWVLNQKIYQ